MTICLYVVSAPAVVKRVPFRTAEIITCKMPARVHWTTSLHLSISHLQKAWPGNAHTDPYDQINRNCFIKN